MIALKPIINSPQRRGIFIIPTIELFRLNRMRSLNAAGQRLYELIFKIGRLVRQGARHLDMLEGRPGGRVRL